ncbi:MAG: hypothetical protein JJU20_10785 [Opitutales bacterium]|nr:hypothetical protein [Opitutales bacterium]
MITHTDFAPRGKWARPTIRLLLFSLLCGFMGLSTLQAQYEIKSGVYNRLSERVPAPNPDGIAPVGPEDSPTGEPTITPQYSNVVEGSASAGPIPSGYANSVDSETEVGVVLQSASVGTSFASGVPRYSYGDTIAPPTVIVDQQGAEKTVASNFWRAEPVRPDEVLTNPSGDPTVDYRTGDTAEIAPLAEGVLTNYYYSPHARRVFANTPGTVSVTWRSRVPDPITNSYVFYSERFVVSSATSRPVRTIFWTEKSFNAPRITIPTGNIVTVNPVYSNVFPETVAEEYKVVGDSQSDPNADASTILRTLWYNNVNGVGELYAYNVTGRIIVEYLGELRDDGSHEFLGADIVSVEQSARPRTLVVKLGEEIRPMPDENLIPVPVNTANTGGEAPFYGSNPRPDGSLAYFAERENMIEDRIVFYWLETHDAAITLFDNQPPGLGISWPKHLNKYLLVWPDDVTQFASYTVGLGGSSVDSGTGLKFEGGKVPQIVFQDGTGSNISQIDTISQRLVVGLGGVDQLNRTLLKFVGNNGGTWYVRLLTQADEWEGFQEGDGGSAINRTVFVGDRIEPPSPEYTLAGYIASGTSYSPHAYIDPFISGIPNAEKGAIIPVNALPGDANPLTVWWFKEVKAPSSEFSNFYIPAKVGRYNLAYRNSINIATETFNDGAIGWSEDRTDVIPGHPGRFLGPFADGPQQPSTEKTFSMDGHDANNATVSFSFLRLDSWDNEDFRVYINGNRVVNEQFNTSEVVDTRTGSIDYGHVNYAYEMIPVPGTYGNSYGGHWPDQAFEVHITATSTEAPVAGTLKLGFDSNLNESTNNESFGIERLSIDVPLPQQIVLASNAGTGALSSAISAGTVYNQPDPNLHGYNPNEEHALIQGGRGYAMRDDLNRTDGTVVGDSFTSLPRVLIQYTDPIDQRPAIAVYEVLRESLTHSFAYPATAGTILGSPMPLPLLPLPLDTNGLSMNREVPLGDDYSDLPQNAGAPASYDPFTLMDRKGYTWVYRGPHDGGSPALGMQFYYTMRSDFVFPGMATQPAVGTTLPYLRAIDENGDYIGDPDTATPLTIHYYPRWPERPPVLTVGETLALPKRGLPAVRGQTSATIVYQQSIANDGTETAVLHDPTRAKVAWLNDTNIGLTALPASLKTTIQQGKTYFQLAQPHLQQRFYFDPFIGDIGALVLEGEFVNAIAGEDYFNLNALSAADIHALEILVDDSDPDHAKWKAAIARLSTTMETFKENPTVKGTYIVDDSKSVSVGHKELPVLTYSDTAVDSYALTALGKGSGYVTLLFADGEAFTSPGDPIMMQVIRVAPELYQGDLKMISASNPLDEQTSLRHSGDFAARPENYEFEWQYSLPVGGMAPPIYEFVMEQQLGTGTTAITDTWHVLANPATLPPESYPESPFPLERSIQINDSNFDASNGLPGHMLKSVSGLTFDGPVPNRIIFSAQLGTSDGFVLYVNDVAALAYQLPTGVSVALVPQAPRSGLVSGGLPYQFEVDPTFFSSGENEISVALYSTQAAGGNYSSIDFRIDTPGKIDRVTAAGSPWILPNGVFTNNIVIGGSAASPLGDPLLVFSDAYFTMRYKAKDSAELVTGESWSEWNTPVLVESWVKRVLAGINPFNQRQTDLYNNPISTDVSILTQAGTRWEGDVALNLDTIEDFGLIEIYETVLNRVKAQILDAGASTEAVDSTLLLVAGYLNDLYMTLGNEAWDDARNPTLLVDTETQIEAIETSRFSFEGQVASLKEETLALLRGRDDFLSPGTAVAPSYNRLYWNYTNGIDSGEPFYAVNYNIQEKSGGPNADGVLDAADAQYMFPQGHGDAYGHYLTALKGYYQLLTLDSFTWLPSTEGVSVLGQTVQVDYMDERKFAAAAAAVARTGVDILDFTARKNHVQSPAAGWASKRDGRYNSATDRTRSWGTDEWASRTAQGAYYHWVNANAMLPDLDLQNEGIQRIDRTTVPELDELVTSAHRILALSVGEQAFLNPLGLAPDAMSFDISPSEMAAGKSFFEQIYDRAVRASVNAKNAFQVASKMNALLREQGNSVDEYNEAITRQEAAYRYQLITLYGTPYAGDIGPGRLYAQGYTGPDLYHSYFINRPSQLVDVSSDVTVEFREPVNFDPFVEWSVDNVYNRLAEPSEYVVRSYQMSPYSLGQFSDTVASNLGRRSQTGAIQAALLDSYEAEVNLRDASAQYSTLMRRFERDYQLYSEFMIEYDAANQNAAEKRQSAASMLKASAQQAAYRLVANNIEAVARAAAEGFPRSVGFSNDATSVGRMAALLSGATAAFAQELQALAAENIAAVLKGAAEDLFSQADSFIAEYEFDSVQKQHVVEFERLYDEVIATGYEITRRLTELQRANERVSQLYAEASHILSERETFRQRAASVIQGYRTRDLVFRQLRNEELEQYKSLFDLAQTYTYMAAKAYDYETGLLGSEVGSAFIDKIVGTYSIGAWDGLNPIETGKGDSGLASILGSLQSDWSVAKGRLGINNPDSNGTVFSLRQELFRIRTDEPTADDDLVWRQVLQQHMMSNVMNDPDVAMYANNIRKADGSAVPGIVISFATTIEPGLNFFGWPLAPGDHAYSQSSFSTKIFASGLVFKGYIGMDPFSEGIPGATGPASSNPNALSATPYAYIIPAGVDTMRTPPLGDTNQIRSWMVKDQALPLPKNIGLADYSSTQFFTPEGSLNEELWIRRKHQAFRAVDDPVYFYSSMPSEFTNRRLIGRSVWNSQWKIVIPAYSLLNDEQEGLDRFAKSISDIKLFLRTYSNAGN